MIVLLCWLQGDLYYSLDLCNACIRLWACDLQLLSLRDGFSLAAVHVLWHYHWFASGGLCFDRSWWHLQLVLVSGFASSNAWLLTLRGFVRKIFKTKFEILTPVYRGTECTCLLESGVMDEITVVGGQPCSGIVKSRHNLVPGSVHCFEHMASFVGGRSGVPLKGEIFELDEIADSSEGSGRDTGQHELSTSQKI